MRSESVGSECHMDPVLAYQLMKMTQRGNISDNSHVIFTAD